MMLVTLYCCAFSTLFALACRCKIFVVSRKGEGALSEQSVMVFLLVSVEGLSRKRNSIKGFGLQ